MKRRLVGLELNGCSDIAARDWSVSGEALEHVEYAAGGVESEAVKIETPRLGTRWIGGPQAALAPHGRGPGWGALGAITFRRSILEAMRAPSEDDNPDVVVAGFEALTRGADFVVLTVPDLPEFDEARQGALLKVLAASRRRVQLVWRSVAAFHALYNENVAKLADGDRVRILLHGPDGIEDQTLVLRNDPERPGHCAPLREGPGRLIRKDLGLLRLFERAGNVVKQRNLHVPWNKCERSHLGPHLLTGDAKPGDVEVLRHQNGTWLKVAAPELTAEDLGITDDSSKFPPKRPMPSATVFVSPILNTLSSQILHSIGVEGPTTVLKNTQALALGALLSARLIERGLPHYFDKLEPIAIAVMRPSGQPVFEPLIGENEIVPANREYRSKELEGFRWGQGKREMEFYVLKGRCEIRHWVVKRDEGPRNDTEIVLMLRQTPGQSWARLSVCSRNWEALARNPVELNWEALKPINMAPEEVLEKLKIPNPEPPERVVEPTNIKLWRGADWVGEGALRLLSRSPKSKVMQLADEWYGILKQPRQHPVTKERFWCVSTDGELPAELSPDDRIAFMKVVERLTNVVMSATLERPLENNNPLLALTWAFTFCPEPVQEQIVEALEAEKANRRHPLLLQRFSRRVLRQAAGRSVVGKARLERLFRYFAACEINNDVLSGLGKALARREEAPDALTREIVDTLAKKLSAELERSVQMGNFRRRFLNTLLALAALFRWRHREPRALIRHTDPVGAELAEAVENTRNLIEQRSQKPGTDFFMTKADELLGIILEHLEGEGDPNILRMIEKEISA